MFEQDIYHSDSMLGGELSVPGFIKPPGATVHQISACSTKGDSIIVQITFSKKGVIPKLQNNASLKRDQFL